MMVRSINNVRGSSGGDGDVNNTKGSIIGYDEVIRESA